MAYWLCIRHRRKNRGKLLKVWAGRNDKRLERSMPHRQQLAEVRQHALAPWSAINCELLKLHAVSSEEAPVFLSRLL